MRNFVHGSPEQFEDAIKNKIQELGGSIQDDVTSAVEIDDNKERYIHTLIGDIQSELQSEVNSITFDTDDDGLIINIVYKDSAVREFHVPFSDLHYDFDEIDADVSYVINALLYDRDTYDEDFNSAESIQATTAVEIEDSDDNAITEAEQDEIANTIWDIMDYARHVLEFDHYLQDIADYESREVGRKGNKYTCTVWLSNLTHDYTIDVCWTNDNGSLILDKSVEDYGQEIADIYLEEYGYNEIDAPFNKEYVDDVTSAVEIDNRGNSGKVKLYCAYKLWGSGYSGGVSDVTVTGDSLADAIWEVSDYLPGVNSQLEDFVFEYCEDEGIDGLDDKSAKELIPEVPEAELIDFMQENEWDEEWQIFVLLNETTHEFYIGEEFKDDPYNTEVMDKDDWDAQNDEVFSSTRSIQATTYQDPDGIMGDPSDTWTTEDLKAYWEANHDSDPVLYEYDSMQSWLDDTIAMLHPITDIEGATDTDSKVVGKTWKDFIQNIESQLGYEVDSADRRKPSHFIDMYKDGEHYVGEITRYHDGTFELLECNIHDYDERG